MADQRDELNEFESELRSLQPRAATIDRDQLMYAAGMAAARPALRGVWTWRFVAGLLLAAAIVQSLRLHFAAPQIIERLVYTGQIAPLAQQAPSLPSEPQQSTPPTSVMALHELLPLNPASWMSQRNLALTAGVDAITQGSTSTSSTSSQTIQTFGQLRDAWMLRDATYTATENDSSDSKERHELEL